jgi:hypothetical protein
MTDIKWLAAPEPHDYPGARAFLLLLLTPKEVDDVLTRLSKAEITFFKAKDILRASRLKPLTDANKHVDRDLKKINRGEALSPILLVRGNLSTGVRLTIADGYHRVCAAYWDTEDVEVACQIVGLE